MNHPIQFAPVRVHSRQIGSGPAVVCLHSSGSSSAQWKGLIAHLAREHRVIAPDLLGHGRSPRAGASTQSILDQDAAQVASIAAANGGVHLVGHSYGGAVALRVALAHPALVRSLVLYEPVVFGVLQGKDEYASLWQEITQTGRTIVLHTQMRRLLAAAKRFVDYWSGDGSWLAMGTSRQDAIARRMPAVADHFPAVFDWQPLAALRNLQVPVLLAHGERTRRVTRAIVEQLAETLPQVIQIRVRSAGHMGPVTHPEAVNAAVLRFLQPEEIAAPALALAA
jgi:pimeloyl-ACP methyl ester carboxylesterase